MNAPVLPSPLDHPVYVQLLSLLVSSRFATTDQLARATAHEYGSLTSARRQTMRHLTRLRDHRLIQKTGRRIGGHRGGSSQTMWAPTARSHQVLTGQRRRIRVELLSTEFIAHTLAVTDTRIVLAEVARTKNLEFTITGEPQCWRTYLNHYGQTTRLKPDLHVHTHLADGDEYAAFIEVDRATENPARIITTCRKYVTYYRTGAETQERGFFPEVLWIVPTSKRAQQLQRYIGQADDLLPEMFTVVTVAELPDTIRRRTTPEEAPKPE